MKADGSVIIDTKIGTNGMEKGFEAIKKEMSSVGVAAENLGDKLKLALSGGASAPIQEAFNKVRELESAFNDADLQYQKEFGISRELEEELAKVNEILSRASSEYISPEEYIDAYVEQDELSVAVEEQKSRVQSLEAQVKTTYAELEAARKRLTTVIANEAKKEAAAEEKAARKALKEKERSYKKATKSARAFGRRLTSIAAGALVFNVISSGLREITQYFGKALKSNQQFSASWGNLKGAALTAIQPIYEVLLPVLTAALSVATKLALVIGRAFASLAGKSTSQMKENAKALYEQANATEKAGKAAKNAKKQLAGFDELNVLSNNNSSGESAETGAANFEVQDIDLNSKLSEMAGLTAAAILALGIILTLSGVNIPLGLGMIVIGGLALYQSIAENWGSIQGNVMSTADAIAFMGGALLLAIGIIVAFCCPTCLGLGLGLIIGGAALLGTAVALNWNAITDALTGPLGMAVGLIAGAVLVVIGILACFAQVWALGIGLIVAGAVFLGGTIALNWNSIEEALKTPLGAAVALFAGAVLVVIGILACFAQNWVLGISCIVAGAAFIVTTIALNWNAIKEALQGPIGGVTAVVSAALLAVGAIIAFSGAGLVLGISLMAAGAIGLATTAALNWNSIKEALQGPIGRITAIVSGALLVLGIILLFVPGAQGLGLGLLIAGAAGLATVVAFNWNSIVDSIKDVWKKIKDFWNNHIAQVFTTKFWGDLAKKCGNGLIGGFEGAINGIISLFETMINWVVKGLNKISFDVPNWVPGIGGKKFGFNIPEAKFKRVSIPRLAQGAVIPPNREFMAVLGDQKHGTNIEAPLETIKQALAEVLALQEGTGETVVTVNFSGDLAQLARVLRPVIETETRRKGGSLAKGGAF